MKYGVFLHSGIAFYLIAFGVLALLAVVMCVVIYRLWKTWPGDDPK